MMFGPTTGLQYSVIRTPHQYAHSVSNRPAHLWDVGTMFSIKSSHCKGEVAALHNYKIKYIGP